MTVTRIRVGALCCGTETFDFDPDVAPALQRIGVRYLRVRGDLTLNWVWWQCEGCGTRQIRTLPLDVALLLIEVGVLYQSWTFPVDEKPTAAAPFTLDDLLALHEELAVAEDVVALMGA